MCLYTIMYRCLLSAVPVQFTQAHCLGYYGLARQTAIDSIPAFLANSRYAKPGRKDLSGVLSALCQREGGWNLAQFSGIIAMRQGR
jgi:hypothetical protein